MLQKVCGKDHGIVHSTLEDRVLLRPPGGAWVGVQWGNSVMKKVCEKDHGIDHFIFGEQSNVISGGLCQSGGQCQSL